MSYVDCVFFFFFFSSRRRHTRSLRDWSSDVCSSDLDPVFGATTTMYQLGVHEFSDQLHPALGPTKLWGYVDLDRKSTRLNSSHVEISYAVFCLKKKKKKISKTRHTV